LVIALIDKIIDNSASSTYNYTMTDYFYLTDEQAAETVAITSDDYIRALEKILRRNGIAFCDQMILAEVFSTSSEIDLHTIQQKHHDWAGLKIEIDARKKIVMYREREVWWCSLGKNIGHEEDGKNALFERPVLILRKFSTDMFWGIPLTSKLKVGKYYFRVKLRDQDSTIILSQLRTLSSKRLIRRMGKISLESFSQVEDKVLGLINETDSLRSPRVPCGNLYNNTTIKNAKNKKQLRKK
jgi:mRNA interferase MazF